MDSVYGGELNLGVTDEGGEQLESRLLDSDGELVDWDEEELVVEGEEEELDSGMVDSDGLEGGVWLMVKMI